MGGAVDGYGDNLATDPIHGQPEWTRFAVANKTVTDSDIRCQGNVEVRTEPGQTKTCNRLLARLAGRPWLIQCSRCKAVNRSPVD